LLNILPTISLEFIRVPEESTSELHFGSSVMNFTPFIHFIVYCCSLTYIADINYKYYTIYYTILYGSVLPRTAHVRSIGLRNTFYSYVIIKGKVR